jgi:hypothetical protein
MEEKHAPFTKTVKGAAPENSTHPKAGPTALARFTLRLKSFAQAPIEQVSD